LTAREQQRMQQSISRGAPFGDEAWVKRSARRLGLESTLRPQGRPKKLPKAP